MGWCSNIKPRKRGPFTEGKKFRLYTQLDSIANKTEVEKGLVIVRWKEKGKENETFEADAIFAEDQIVENEQTKTIDLSMTRPTQSAAAERSFR